MNAIPDPVALLVAAAICDVQGRPDIADRLMAIHAEMPQPTPEDQPRHPEMGRQQP